MMWAWLLFAAVALPALVANPLAERWLRASDSNEPSRARVVYRLRGITLAMALLFVGALWCLTCLSFDAENAVSLSPAAVIAFAVLTVAVGTACTLFALRPTHEVGFWGMLRRSLPLGLPWLVPMLAAWSIHPMVRSFNTASEVAAVAIVGAVCSVFVGPWTMSKVLGSKATPNAENGSALRRVVVLPTPSRKLIHVAFFDPLRTIFITDAAEKKLATAELQALSQLTTFRSKKRPGKGPHTLFALALCALCFGLAEALAATTLQRAALLGVASMAALLLHWRSDRRTLSSPEIGSLLLSLNPADLASALSTLQPHTEQRFPKTRNVNLAPSLYSRLFALGLDPGPPPSVRWHLSFP